MLTLISSKICPFVQRVAALLAARDVPHDIRYISLKDKPRWFTEIAPHGQVPVLLTETGTPIFESEAIVEYINECWPDPTLAAPEARAEARAWGYLAAKFYLGQCSQMRSATAETLAERSAQLDRPFDRMEARLGETAFFAGNRPGHVDFAWLPLLHRSAIVKEHSGHDLLGGRPKLSAWRDSLLQSGVAQASVAADFEDIFAAFYLSGETYLGQQSGRCTPEPSRQTRGCGTNCC